MAGCNQREGSARQADQTSRFHRDSPGLERDVPVSRKDTFGTHLCPSLQKAVPIGTEGITCDNGTDSSRFSMQLPDSFTRPEEVNTCLHFSSS